MNSTSLVLLDSCTVVNLYATRRMMDIVKATFGIVAIVDVVERESQFVRGGEDGNEREPVDLEPLKAAGAIWVLTSDDESELMTFIDLTQELDDGEAMTAAVAIHRHGAVVTDDRKASRLLGDRDVPILTTLYLCKSWAESAAEAPESVRAALVAIRERGRYEPPRSHALRPWWESVLRSS